MPLSSIPRAQLEPASAPPCEEAAPKDFHPEANDSHRSYQAMLNVLEDFNQDRVLAGRTNGAILNILEDFDGDKRLLSDTNRAVINILEDLEEAKSKTEVLNAQLEQRVLERTGELAHSEARFRLLVEGVRDCAIYMLDTVGNVASWNAGAERIKGYQADEVQGKPYARFFTLEDREVGKPADDLRIALEDGQFKAESWRVRKDGSKFLADVLITPMTNEAGQLLGFVKLTRDITERKAAEISVREALRQEMLLKEIHHRVKNNLQVISSLLYLQSTHVDDKKMLEVLAESQSRVKSIALIHEKLYRSADLEKLAFGDYVKDLVGELARTYGIHRERITVHTDIQQIHLGIDTAVPCGLIINELVVNAFKHAFGSEPQGEVRIGLQQTQECSYILTVRDNGIGFPANFDWRKCKSLGLKLVMDLTKQLGGQLAISGELGTQITITFAELQYKERR